MAQFTINSTVSNQFLLSSTLLLTEVAGLGATSNLRKWTGTSRVALKENIPTLWAFQKSPQVYRT